VAETPLERKVAILADLWMVYREEEEWQDFIAFSDLGLPLAFMLDNEIVPIRGIQGSPAEELIHDTFELLLKGLDINEDTGFDSLEDVLGL
jgi:hypothetical protein